MKNKRGKRIKHVPQRTCVGCKQVGDKRNFIRLVKEEDKGRIVIDMTGKLPGRGIYLHKIIACWKLALPSAISKGLKTDVSELDLERINSFMQTLSVEE